MSKARKNATGAKWKVTKTKWHKLNPAPHICWLCNQPITGEVTLDHVADWATYPEYRYELSNLRPAHQWCNNERHAKTLNRLRGRKILKR